MSIGKIPSKRSKFILRVTEEEWIAARKFFDDPINSSITKLEKTDKSKTHSFIKVDGIIYAMSNKNIPLEKYLGKGSEGKSKVIQKEDGDCYAVKIEARDERPKDDRELEILKKIKYGDESYYKGQRGRKLDKEKPLFKEREGELSRPTLTKLYTVTELIPGESLDKLLDKDSFKKAPDLQKLIIALKCCLQIDKLHKMRIIHGDINKGNFMISNNESAMNTIDFTEAAITPIDFSYSHLLPKDKTKVTGQGGALLYQAPEIRTSFEHSFASDIYALGHMFQNDFHFGSNTDMNILFDKMKTEKPNERPQMQEITNSLIEEIKKCTKDDSSRNVEKVISEALEQINSKPNDQEEEKPDTEITFTQLNGFEQSYKSEKSNFGRFERGPRLLIKSSERNPQIKMMDSIKEKVLEDSSLSGEKKAAILIGMMERMESIIGNPLFNSRLLVAIGEMKNSIFLAVGAAKKTEDYNKLVPNDEFDRYVKKDNSPIQEWINKLPPDTTETKIINEQYSKLTNTESSSQNKKKVKNT